MSSVFGNGALREIREVKIQLSHYVTQRKCLTVATHLWGDDVKTLPKRVCYVSFLLLCSFRQVTFVHRGAFGAAGTSFRVHRQSPTASRRASFTNKLRLRVSRATSKPRGIFSQVDTPKLRDLVRWFTRDLRGGSIRFARRPAEIRRKTHPHATAWKNALGREV